MADKSFELVKQIIAAYYAGEPFIVDLHNLAGMLKPSHTLSDKDYKIYEFVCAKGRVTISDVASKMKLSVRTTSLHLNGLLDAGMISKYRDGPATVWEVTPDSPFKRGSPPVNQSSYPHIRGYDD